MISFRSSLGAFSVFCLLNACSNPHANQNDAMAPKLIGDSFVISKIDDNSIRKEQLIGIQRKSLEKEFLLQGQVIMQPGMAQFHGLKSRIVSFKETNGHVEMLETTDGHSSTSTLPQNIVLAKFKIVRVSENVLYFDFAEGMSKIFTMMDWQSSDGSKEEAKYQSLVQWISTPLVTSYIEEAKADDNNNLVIRQVAQMESAKTSETSTVHIPVELKYYLTPYRESKGFVPRESPGFDKMGFFEVSPRLLTGGDQKIFASRWDERKGITYAISSNTPKEFRQAIKDGALYWNKAFGKEIVRIIDAPPGVVAPDFYYNVIQWVDNSDNAGYAYADAQMDPRTGEILHASVFLTSVFGFSAKNKARQLLRRLQFDAKKAKGNSHFSLAGFQQQHLCDHPTTEGLAQTLSDVLSKIEEGTLKESVLLKLAQDTVRETVAHEIGHTLGMRHQFAGSLASNIPNDKRDEVFNEYVAQGKLAEGMVPSSSVMDYHVFTDGLFLGDRMQSAPDALEYDRKAIQKLYFDVEPKDMPVFCTDSHVGKYIDCVPFDYGSSELAFIKQTEQKSLEALPYVLMEAFIASKSAPASAKSKPFAKALSKPAKVMTGILAPRLHILQALTNDAKFLKAPDSTIEYVESEIANGGGLESFLSPLDMKSLHMSLEKFNDLVDSDVYSRSEGLGGKFEFTDDEKVLMKQLAQDFYAELPAAFFHSELKMYNMVEDFSDSKLTMDLFEIFSKRASFLMFASMGDLKADLSLPNKPTVAIEVPQFLFPTDLRVEAAGLLSGVGEGKLSRLWSYRSRSAFRKHLKETADTAFKTNVAKLSLDDLSDELALWMMDYRKVYAALLE